MSQEKQTPTQAWRWLVLRWLGAAILVLVFLIGIVVLVFQQYTQGDVLLYTPRASEALLIDLETQIVHRFLDNLDVPMGCPMWSPDGKLVEFATDGTLEPCWNCIMDRLQRLKYAYAPATHDTTWTSWSPDSQQIIYTHQGNLYINSADGKHWRPLVENDGMFITYFEWSPKGDNLAIITREPDFDGPTVYIYDIKSSTESLIGVGWDIAWSPEGNTLAFVRIGEASGEDVWVYDLLTQTQHQLTSASSDDNRPVWLDSTQLLFNAAHEPSLNEPQLFVADIAAGNVMPFNETPERPNLSPSGRHFVQEGIRNGETQPITVFDSDDREQFTLEALCYAWQP